MAAGPVEYKRKYTLWVLVLLIIVCWPVAIIYYFTRPKVPVQELQPSYMVGSSQPNYAAPPPAAAGAPAGAQGGRFCPSCGAGGQPASGFCSACGKALPP